MTRANPAAPGATPKGALTADVVLTRVDFETYNWVLALERPVLPFFMYTFALLLLADLLRVWQDARLYAFAVVVPALGYLLFVKLSSLAVWRRYPELREPKRYTFKENAFQVKQAGKTVNVPYKDVAHVLESRRAYYLVRMDGSADILPKRAVEEGVLEPLLKDVRWKRSSFL